MERAPIKADSPLFSSTRVFRMIFEGILIGTLAVIAFAVGASSGGFAVGRTMSFLTLGISQLFHSFNLRSEKSVFSRKVKSNPFVIFSFVFCLALQTLVVLIPKAANLFGVASLSGKQWLMTFLLSCCPLVFTEIYKSLKK
jgi:Ca2+-transporting ATPase